MKRSLILWQIGGLTFSAVLGTLFHFLYNWTDFILFAPFSALNESTWEHMKLLFFPSFIFAIIQSIFFLKDYPLFWRIKLIGIMVGLLIIPTLFYTYNGVIGKSPDFINIAIFFISAAMAYVYETRLFLMGGKACKNPKRALAFLCVIALAFILFTFKTPPIEIFKDPLTGEYGIAA
jgi:hypothetical protein